MSIRAPLALALLLSCLATSATTSSLEELEECSHVALLQTSVTLQPQKLAGKNGCHGKDGSECEEEGVASEKQPAGNRKFIMMAATAFSALTCVVHLGRGIPAMCPCLERYHHGAFWTAHNWSKALGVRNSVGLMFSMGVFDMFCAALLFFSFLPGAQNGIGHIETQQLAACGAVSSNVILTLVMIMAPGVLAKAVAAISYVNTALRYCAGSENFSAYPMQLTSVFLAGILFCYVPLCTFAMPPGVGDAAGLSNTAAQAQAGPAATLVVQEKCRCMVEAESAWEEDKRKWEVAKESPENTTPSVQ